MFLRSPRKDWSTRGPILIMLGRHLLRFTRLANDGLLLVISLAQDVIDIKVLFRCTSIVGRHSSRYLSLWTALHALREVGRILRRLRHLLVRRRSNIVARFVDFPVIAIPISQKLRPIQLSRRRLQIIMDSTRWIYAITLRPSSSIRHLLITNWPIVSSFNRKVLLLLPRVNW